MSEGFGVEEGGFLPFEVCYGFDLVVNSYSMMAGLFLDGSKLGRNNEPLSYLSTAVI